MIDRVVGRWKKEVLAGFKKESGSLLRLDSVQLSPAIAGKSKALRVRMHGLTPEALRSAESRKAFLDRACDAVAAALTGSSIAFSSFTLPWASVMAVHPEIENPDRLHYVAIEARVTHSSVEQVNRTHLNAALRHVDV